MYKDSLVSRVDKNRIVSVGSVTLAAGATTTEVFNLAMSKQNWVHLYPQTANAAAVVASTYLSTRDTRSFTITHPNDANADKTFSYIIVAGDLT